MIIANKYFEQATAMFLTETLTYKEFNKLLNDGVCLPVCKDYEGWDPDHLENHINEVAEAIEKEVLKEERLKQLEEQNKALIERINANHCAIDTTTDMIKDMGLNLEDSEAYVELLGQLGPNEELLKSIEEGGKLWT